MYASILNPVLALILWTLIIWAVMYARRLPAMQKAGIKPDDARHPGSLDTLPPPARAAADNYNHLHEQPTLFYALCFWLHLKMTGVGGADNFTLGLAWGYVTLRIVHSLVQITFNRVPVRFALFMLSTLLLAVMAFRAVFWLL